MFIMNNYLMQQMESLVNMKHPSKKAKLSDLKRLIILCASWCFGYFIL